MSSLFFSFDLTASLHSEKTLPEKSVALTGNTAHSNNFDTLLREQLLAQQNDLPNENAQAGLSENVVEEPKAPDAPSPIAEPLPENPESAPIPTVSAGNQPLVSFKNAADEPVEAFNPTPLLTSPPHDWANTLGAPGAPSDQAAPLIEQNPAAGLPLPAQRPWQFDRQLSHETADTSFRIENRSENSRIENSSQPQATSAQVQRESWQATQTAPLIEQSVEADFPAPVRGNWQWVHKLPNEALGASTNGANIAAPSITQTPFDNEPLAVTADLNESSTHLPAKHTVARLNEEFAALASTVNDKAEDLLKSAVNPSLLNIALPLNQVVVTPPGEPTPLAAADTQSEPNQSALIADATTSPTELPQQQPVATAQTTDRLSPELLHTTSTVAHQPPTSFNHATAPPPPGLTDSGAVTPGLIPQVTQTNSTVGKDSSAPAPLLRKSTQTQSPTSPVGQDGEDNPVSVSAEALTPTDRAANQSSVSATTVPPQPQPTLTAKPPVAHAVLKTTAVASAPVDMPVNAPVEAIPNSINNEPVLETGATHGSGQVQSQTEYALYMPLTAPTTGDQVKPTSTTVWQQPAEAKQPGKAYQVEQITVTPLPAEAETVGHTASSEAPVPTPVTKPAFFATAQAAFGQLAADAARNETAVTPAATPPIATQFIELNTVARPRGTTEPAETARQSLPQIFANLSQSAVAGEVAGEVAEGPAEVVTEGVTEGVTEIVAAAPATAPPLEPARLDKRTSDSSRNAAQDTPPLETARVITRPRVEPIPQEFEQPLQVPHLEPTQLEQAPTNSMLNRAVDAQLIEADHAATTNPDAPVTQRAEQPRLAWSEPPAQLNPKSASAILDVLNAAQPIETEHAVATPVAKADAQLSEQPRLAQPEKPAQSSTPLASSVLNIMKAKQASAIEYIVSPAADEHGAPAPGQPPPVLQPAQEFAQPPAAEAAITGATPSRALHSATQPELRLDNPAPNVSALPIEPNKTVAVSSQPDETITASALSNNGAATQPRPANPLQQAAVLFTASKRDEIIIHQPVGLAVENSAARRPAEPFLASGPMERLTQPAEVKSDTLPAEVSLAATEQTLQLAPDNVQADVAQSTPTRSVQLAPDALQANVAQATPTQSVQVVPDTLQADVAQATLKQPVQIAPDALQADASQAAPTQSVEPAPDSALAAHPALTAALPTPEATLDTGAQPTRLPVELFTNADTAAIANASPIANAKASVETAIKSEQTVGPEAPSKLPTPVEANAEVVTLSEQTVNAEAPSKLSAFAETTAQPIVEVQQSPSFEAPTKRPTAGAAIAETIVQPEQVLSAERVAKLPPAAEATANPVVTTAQTFNSAPPLKSSASDEAGSEVFIPIQQRSSVEEQTTLHPAAETQARDSHQDDSSAVEPFVTAGPIEPAPAQPASVAVPQPVAPTPASTVSEPRLAQAEPTLPQTLATRETPGVSINNEPIPTKVSEPSAQTPNHSIAAITQAADAATVARNDATPSHSATAPEALSLTDENFVEAERVTHATLPSGFDRSNHVAALPANERVTSPVSVPLPTPVEPASKPLTVNQVVRTVLQDDYSSVRPATPTNTSTAAPTAKLEAVSPQAAPFTSTAIPQSYPTMTAGPASRTASAPTITFTPPLIPSNIEVQTEAAVEAQPAIKIEAQAALNLAAQPALNLAAQPVLNLAAQPALNLAAQPDVNVEAPPALLVEPADAMPTSFNASKTESSPTTTLTPLTAPMPPIATAPPSAEAAVEAPTATLPNQTLADLSLPTAPAPNEPSVLSASPETVSTAPRSVLQTETLTESTAPTVVGRETDESFRVSHPSTFTTGLPERTSRTGHRTFQLVLEPQAATPAATPYVFGHERPEAAAEPARLPQPVPTALPKQSVTGQLWPTITTTVTTEPQVHGAQIQPSPVVIPDAIVEGTQTIQSPTPLDRFEAAPSAAPFVAEPTRPRLAAIEQHIANSTQPTARNVEFITPPTPEPLLNSRPPVVVNPFSGLYQTATLRELIQPSFFKTVVAEPTEGIASPVMVGVGTSDTVTQDLTDAWLGQRQIPDQQVSPTNAEGVGTLTPLTPTVALDPPQPVEPRHTDTLATTYFSPAVTTNLWASNSLANNSSANWTTPQSITPNVGTSRWAAAIHQVAGQVTMPVRPVVGKDESPLPAMNIPAPTPTEVAQPVKPSVPNTSTPSSPMMNALEATTESMPAQPLQPTTPPIMESAETAPLSVAPRAAVLARAALRDEHASVNTAQDSLLQERAAQLSTPPAWSQSETLTKPSLNSAGVALPSEASTAATRESAEPASVNAAEAATTFPVERGTAVAQSTGARDDSGMHVTRQLADPVITASTDLRPNEPRTIRLKLRPDTLGEVEIVLRYDAAGHLHAQMTAEREQTTHVLRGQLDQLRETLQQAGLQVGQLDITTNPGPHGQSGQGWHTGGQDAQHTHTPAARIPEAESVEFEPTAHGGATTGLDRLINLLA